MRVGEVIGKLTLGVADSKLKGGRFLLVRPHDPESLRKGTQNDAEVVVVYDELGGQVGDRVSFSEGREGAMPFWPDHVAVDAYLSCLLDTVTYDDEPRASR
jgi:microcompartment protein CcmK/EutM